MNKMDKIIKDVEKMEKEEEVEVEEDIREKKAVSVLYKIKVKIKKEVEDKIKWLTHNYAEEISAFLTGEIKEDIITIDGMLFPHQDVSHASIEVEPKNLIKLRKEYGDECKRIIGHWHSHNTMQPFWSVTDDKFMEEYSKTKDISIFFVSSVHGRHTVKLFMNKPFEISFDNLNYDVVWSDKKFEEDLRKVIKEKVTSLPPPVVQDFQGYEEYGNYPQDNRYYPANQYGQGGLSEEQEVLRQVKKKINESIKYSQDSGNIHIKDLSRTQAINLMSETEIDYPELVKTKGGQEVVYKTKNKEHAIILIKNIKFYLEDIYEVGEDYSAFGG